MPDFRTFFFASVWIMTNTGSSGENSTSQNVMEDGRSSIKAKVPSRKNCPCRCLGPDKPSPIYRMISL
jgi:hypothetical protein